MYSNCGSTTVNRANRARGYKWDRVYVLVCGCLIYARACRIFPDCYKQFQNYSQRKIYKCEICVSVVLGRHATAWNFSPAARPTQQRDKQAYRALLREHIDVNVRGSRKAMHDLVGDTAESHDEATNSTREGGRRRTQ